MSVMLVGADYVGGIEKNLQMMGIYSIDHNRNVYRLFLLIADGAHCKIN